MPSENPDMKSPRTFALLLAAGAGTLASAGWAASTPDSACRVHGPSRLVSGGDSGTSDYIAHYVGECRDGMAHGEGRLEWRYRWTPGKTRAVWEGRFVDGVFVGSQPVEHVAPLSGDRFLIPLGYAGEQRVSLISRSGQLEPLVMCDIDRVVVEAGMGMAVERGNDTAPDLSRDDVVKPMLEVAASLVHAQCPDVDEAVFELYEREFEFGPNGNWPSNAIAIARFVALASGSGTFASYSNTLGAKAKQEARMAERRDLLRRNQERFVAFTRKHQLASWLKTDHVDRNPFAWQGRRVGMLLRLERMIDPEHALMAQATNAAGSSIVLGGVTPDTFRKPAAAVVVQIDSERVTVNGFHQPVSSARLIASEPCDDAACAMWAAGDGNGIAWGEPIEH